VFRSLNSLLTVNLGKMPFLSAGMVISGMQILSIVFVITIGIQNFKNFIDLNRMVQIFHTYPLDFRQFPRNANSINSNVDNFNMLRRDSDLAEEYSTLVNTRLKKHQKKYMFAFNYYKEHPMGTELYYSQVMKMFGRD
jgi:hypothetical protein